MVSTEDIICISSIDWDFIWQGHQEIMTRLAQGGNRVLFIENTGVRIPGLRDFKRIKSRIINWRKGFHGIRKIEDRLYVYSPLVLPFPYLRLARFINKRIIFSVLFKWLKAVGFSEPVVWVFLPTGLSLDLVNELEPKVLIYYCIDSFQASSKDARKIKRTEKLILKKADLTFVTSQALFDYSSQYNKNVYYFPFAVNIDNFMKVFNRPHTIPPDIKTIKRPIAGYVGGVHKWIDFDLVKEAAIRNNDVSFVFCGPIQTNVSELMGLDNVIFLGQKDPKELPFYVNEFDIAIIPYKLTDYTRNVYPTKLNEYLSLGKPVISTRLPEITKFNIENQDIVKVADTKEKFAHSIRDTLRHPMEEKEKDFAMEIARKNSWSARIEEMSKLIEDMAFEKTKEKEKAWKDNISRFYKRTKKKLIPIAFAIAILYTVIFRTPLLWFLASPLSIKDMPKKADVIVALGGGVGESGKVGQGHEERVDSASKLYRIGFADKIIYSSGYKYIMKEAHVMKALSIFMGVEANNIIIDDTPITTYEMLLHLKDFMEKNNWRDVILVSSPYHMRRLKFLCDKHLEGANVYFVPIEKSSFYDRSSYSFYVKMKQIRGIAHEYLAILYYKLKGYI